jgi:hypothetical protein
MNLPSNSVASIILRGNHFGAARGTTQTVLLLIGLVFAGVLFWAIERNRRASSR